MCQSTENLPIQQILERWFRLFTIGQKSIVESLQDRERKFQKQRKNLKLSSLKKRNYYKIFNNVEFQKLEGNKNNISNNRIIQNYVTNNPKNGNVTTILYTPKLSENFRWARTIFNITTFFKTTDILKLILIKIEAEN